MNWGKGITIALALFMSFIIVLVVSLMSNKIDLESEDYYAREVAYEEEIQAIKNAQSSLPILLKQEEGKIVVQIPEGMKYTDVEILFKRPDDEKKDQLFKMDNSRMLVLENDLFSKGVYAIEISYLKDKEPCLIKESIYI